MRTLSFMWQRFVYIIEMLTWQFYLCKAHTGFTLENYRNCFFLLSLSSSFKNRSPAIGELYLYQETMSPFMSILFKILCHFLKSLSVARDCVGRCLSVKLITLGCFRGKLVNIVLSAETHHFVSQFFRKIGHRACLWRRIQKATWNFS